MHILVGIQRINTGNQFLRCGFLRQSHMVRADAKLCTRLFLVANVDFRRRIHAHDDDGKAWVNPHCL